MTTSDMVVRPPASTSAPRPGAAVAGPNPHDVRRTLLGLLASALGVFPLCQLFTDRGWLIDVWLSMAVVIAPAALLRRRHVASASQIWVGVLVLVPWLTVNFLRGHAIFGVLPFVGAWHDVGRLMTELHNTTRDEVAPVHTTVGIRLAICALLGLAAALVDLLAVVGRRGALAGVPLLVIFVVSGAVPRHPVAWIWFVPAAAAFLVLLALDSSDDLQRWGHYVPRANRVRRRSAGAVSGQRIATAAITLALVAPIFLPSDSRNFVSNLFHHGRGAGADSFGADSTSGSGTGGIDPFASLHGQLTRDKNIDLLSVRISSESGQVGRPGGVEPFYLRTNVLSDFVGDGWRPGPRGISVPISDTQFPSSPGTAFPPRVVLYSADVTVTGLASNPPVFGSPTAVTGIDGATKWSPRDMLLTGSQVRAGETIHEDVAQPQPSVDELKAATPRDPAIAEWLKLPGIRPYVRDLTARVTAKAATPYAKARAISDFFADPRNQFTYSLQTANGDSGDDLTDFLRNRIGYCQQYAAAMGVMLRLSGVPARVVLGYAHPVLAADGTFKITTYDAHAWVEAYFTGVGWVPFDPTPLAGISGGSANDLGWAPHGKATGLTDVPDKARPSTGASARPAPDVVAPAAAKHARHGASLGGPLALATIVLAIALLLLIPAAARARRRRRRLRRARQGDTEALWAELSDSATDLGYVWSAARTPRQVASWLGTTSEQASGSLRTLTAAVERTRYAPTEPEFGPAESGRDNDLVNDLVAVLAGLRSRRTTFERLRAMFWPASLGWTRVRWVGRWLPGRPVLGRPVRGRPAAGPRCPDAGRPAPQVGLRRR